MRSEKLGEQEDPDNKEHEWECDCNSQTRRRKRRRSSYDYFVCSNGLSTLCGEELRRFDSELSESTDAAILISLQA